MTELEIKAAAEQLVAEWDAKYQFVKSSELVFLDLDTPARDMWLQLRTLLEKQPTGSYAQVYIKHPSAPESFDEDDRDTINDAVYLVVNRQRGGGYWIVPKDDPNCDIEMMAMRLT